MNRGIVDTSSLIWTGILKGTDKENGIDVFHEGRKVHVNSAGYGYENVMLFITNFMTTYSITPAEMIFVIEGDNTKALRRLWLTGYKGEGKDSRPPEAYAAFNECKRMVLASFAPVGASSATQNGVEGDDVITFLAEGLDGNRFILSNDKDMGVLVGPRDNGYIHQFRMGDLDVNGVGPFEHKYISLYLGLVGDDADGVPGAKGFGDKSFLNMAVEFGYEGLDALTSLLEMEASYLVQNGKVNGKWLATLSEDVASFKPLQKILDNLEMTIRSYTVTKLRPERVNTLRNPLRWSLNLVKGVTDYDALRKYQATTTLVTANNYAKGFAGIKKQIELSPFVALDIETSTPDESDEWLGRMADQEDGQKVDVFGSELTGMGLTFGENSQHTIYISVDHAETPNVTVDDCRAVVECIPRTTATAIQNLNFELPVLFNTWGDKWAADKAFHGFLVNCDDTKLMASYVDENLRAGLKSLSKHYYDYNQETYKEVTTLTGEVGSLPAGGVLLSEGVNSDTGFTHETRQYKMCELTARHVLSYGADDTICTAALYRHFKRVMEIENTWEVYRQVEIKPAYMTALAFVQGTSISPKRLREIAEEDDLKYNTAWSVVRDFLISKGWEGVACPVYDELTPANIKDALYRLTGVEFTSRKRKLDLLGAEIRALTPESEFEGMKTANMEDVGLFGLLVEEGKLAEIQQWVERRHTGEPILDINSPKKMQGLLYDTIGLRVQLVNKTTPADWSNKPEQVKAISKHKKIWAGAGDLTLSKEDLVHVRAKAKSDDKAIQFAILDFEGDHPTSLLLQALRDMKQVDTRRKLYYRPYANIRHWKDGKVHAQINQCAAVTRRPSSSGPNLFALAKKGDGVKVRECYVPHKRRAVIVSIDFNGQELRLMAGQSLDVNMMACYVGDNLKDPHSITASGAMRTKWGEARVTELEGKYGAGIAAGPTHDYELFRFVYKKLDTIDPELAKEAEDLRKVAKNVNFAAQFDALAPKIAETIIVKVADAQVFLDAKYAMFPRVETWKAEVRDDLMVKGYVSTLLGGRRHLRESVLGSRSQVSEAGRQGPNFMIQGSAAEQTKLAMARVWDSGILFDLDMVFIAPIYDELVWSVTVEDCVESIRVIHAAMCEPYSTLPVPIIGSISLGANFGKQIELGEEFDAKVIQEALDTLFPAEEKLAA